MMAVGREGGQVQPNRLMFRPRAGALGRLQVAGQEGLLSLP